MKRVGILLFGLLTLSPTAMGDTFRFSRNCPIFAEPQLGAKRICRRRAGDPIKTAKNELNGFREIEAGGCTGFASSACVEENTSELKQRTVASLPDGRNRSFRVTVSAALDGTLGKTDGASTGSRGQGWLSELKFSFPLSRRTLLSLGGTYHVLGLGRDIDFGSGSLGSAAANFNQRILYWGVKSSVSIALQSPRESDLATEIWLEGGLELLLPQKGFQTDSLRGEIEFTPTEKPLLLFVGPWIDVPLSSAFSLQFAGHAFYNVASRNGNSLYGGRVGVALCLSL